MKIAVLGGEMQNNVGAARENPWVKSLCSEIRVNETVGKDTEEMSAVTHVRNVNQVSRRLADTSTADAKLGFRADVGLQEDLLRLVEWWRAQQAA